MHENIELPLVQICNKILLTFVFTSQHSWINHLLEQILPHSLNSEAHKWHFNSDKQNGMVNDVKLFQARKEDFLKQFWKWKFGVHFLPFLSENAYVVSLSQGSNTLHTMLRLHTLHYSPTQLLRYLSKNLEMKTLHWL